MIVDAADQPGGSWPRYYDSLTLFSPARFSIASRAAAARSAQPPPEPGRHDPLPQGLRDSLPAARTHRCPRARRQLGRRSVRDDLGRRRPARRAFVIAASGGFGRPVIPELPGATSYTGRLLHSAGYQNRRRIRRATGGGGRSGQLRHPNRRRTRRMANVTLATRSPIRFVRQAPLRNRPPLLGALERHRETTARSAHPQPARSTRRRTLRCRGRSRAARPAADVQTPDARGVIWPDGTQEHIDSIILATGYRPDVDYLAAIGALDRPAGRYTAAESA